MLEVEPRAAEKFAKCRDLGSHCERVIDQARAPGVRAISNSTRDTPSLLTPKAWAFGVYTLAIPAQIGAWISLEHRAMRLFQAMGSQMEIPGFTSASCAGSESHDLSPVGGMGQPRTTPGRCLGGDQSATATASNLGRMKAQAVKHAADQELTRQSRTIGCVDGDRPALQKGRNRKGETTYPSRELQRVPWSHAENDGDATGGIPRCASWRPVDGGRYRAMAACQLLTLAA